MRSHFFYHDKKIFYHIEGKGKHIVFLHGFLENLHIWDDFSRELSKDFTILTIDLPGHGDSELTGEECSMQMMSEIVAAALYLNNISKCIMIGHSMGGYVTLEFAERYPDMLKGFGLFHSHALADSPEGKENRNRVIEVVKKNHKNFILQFFPDLFAIENLHKFKNEIDKFVQSAGKMSKEAIISASVAMRDREDKMHVLKSSKVPVLFIFGRKDKKLPVSVALEQAALPYNSEIYILGNVAHMGYIEERNNTLFTIKSFALKYL
jgi:pimeloyl-ACP methyl ester carboxylesterase